MTTAEGAIGQAEGGANHNRRRSPGGGLARLAAALTVMASASASTVVSAQPAAATTAANADKVGVYAAGSLRDLMGLLEKGFAEEQRGKRQVGFEFLYGPSGKLRERIEAGETPQLFASASPAHTGKLVESGKLRSSSLFASNSLCALSRDDLRIGDDNFVATLLDPALKLGTSTPGADPSGDYTWDMFRKIGTARAGAFEALDRKALKLTGAEVGNQTNTESAYARLLLDRKADVFITYCTNARSAQVAVPSLRSARVPAAFDVAASYAIGIAPGASDSAREFLRYVLSQRAQVAMASLGFSPPPQRCDRVDEPLKAAYAAWTKEARAVASSAATAATAIGTGEKLNAGLHAGNTLAFGKRPQGAAADRFGGALSFTPAVSGHVEVFLDRRGWIDIVRARDQKPLESLRADRWLGCAGVGKNLGFMVEKGERYELRLSEIEVPRVDVLLMPIAPRNGP